MKRKLGLGLIFTLIFTLVACSSESDKVNDTQNSEESRSNSESTEAVSASAEGTFDTGAFNEEVFKEVFDECMTKAMLAHENSPGAYDNEWEDYNGFIEAAAAYTDALSCFDYNFPEYDDYGAYEQTVSKYIDLVYEMNDYRLAVEQIQKKTNANEDASAESEQIYNSTIAIGDMIKDVLVTYAYEDGTE